MEIDRLFYQDLKYRYKLINNTNNNVLAESDYYDYLTILLNDLRELHQGICDPDCLIIIKEVVSK